MLQSSYPDVPKDFLQFLREVGAGTIGSSRLKVYGFFLSADEVFPSEAAARLRDVLLVADNFGGLCLGYEVCDDWRLVLVDPVGERVPLPVGSFTDYIRRNLLKKV